MRILRVGRLFRVLKLGRYSESLNRIGRVVKSKRADLAASVFFIVVLIVIASSLMYHAEFEAQPDKFASIPATMWWAVSALTSVGYGDIYPVTGWGKLLASVIAILGIGLFALPTGILASGFAEEARQERLKRDCCPHCGKSLKLEAD
jgi:voltage-gated potassium channel